MTKATIDTTCLGPTCNSCVGTCPWGAITADSSTGQATIDPTKCQGVERCASYNGGTTFCQDYCPVGAIV